MILRCFNVAGAHAIENLRKQGSKHLVKICAEAACGKRSYVEIYGADYQTIDGTCVRDYLHVKDMARAHLLAYKNLEKGNPGQILNCGSGFGSSVFDVIKTMQKISGKNFASQIRPRRSGDLPTVLANPMKVKNILGWRPEFDNLESICRSAFEAEANGML
jgi:UDP-glucose 4-epimerase